MGHHSIQQGLESVHRLMDLALDAAKRPRGSVSLVAVSKTQPPKAIREAFGYGQIHFGENYLQEALSKQEALRDVEDIIWHFIGPIQSNKTRQIAERFSWVHGIDRLKIAERLNDQRPPAMGPLNVCIQVNISEEYSKSGVKPDEVAALAQQIEQLPHLKLRGLMGIPEVPDGMSEPRMAFRALRQLKEALLPIPLDTLSMGMSLDFESAILEGATMIRVGSRIFGARDGAV
ncbi:MAG: YggS family pyridoxal phosphate-dependent enzyme [Gammaproteobacteria bacterium]|nr:YggS family pyridoxal phosphate-dependent enzyme [Gammaproteobacteria bacterium]NBT44035.1 YggS family pyridoxal phosphate-dependent enzyme [Gammaproteobacteria bacterium]NBY21499.1 YggS family pyridoxal phosphate-dependent enzyme [Gammaproteobacteria bacterium]NDE34172.1 YggS family pyridoxal phosphate-dependent enzyme [Gammaproteobacteria bacterium]NDE56149.1 YggS family pyridoxal phosphate-dependent enzyme [Gammaproteobacteria bacterium]